MEFDKYVATGGQSSRPFGQFKVPYPKWERLKRPEEVGITDLPDIDLNPKYRRRDGQSVLRATISFPALLQK